MSSIVIEIRIPELAMLAQALAGTALFNTSAPSAPVLQPVAPVSPAPLPPQQSVNPMPGTPTSPMTGAVSTVPVAAPAPLQPAPIAPSINPAPQPAAPTGAPPAFTYDDLARAASSLMDAGKQKDLLALLAQFGVQALTQLPKEQYGAFATALRGMGARI